MERKRGIEPPNSAWEADVLPLNYSRGKQYHITTKRFLQVVNEKIDEIYRFVTIDANAEAKALETIMSQDGHVDPAFKFKQ